ncbi:uncharacterized protein METZ01_LOCUS415827, partial [marine metagenome]
VAYRAVGELLNLDAVVLYELGTQFLLITGRGPIHVEDVLPRPDVFFGIPVTLQAPLHVEGVLLPHQRHLVDLTVAGDTADSLVDVDVVLEVDEVRQIVDSGPLQGLVVAEGGAHGFEKRRFSPDQRMTG